MFKKGDIVSLKGKSEKAIVKDCNQRFVSLYTPLDSYLTWDIRKVELNKTAIPFNPTFSDHQATYSL